MRIESCQVSWHWHLTFSFRSVLRSTLWVKKNWTLLFEHNFRKYCPILIILASNLWPSNSPDLNPVDYEIWAVMQHHVYHRQTIVWMNWNGGSSMSGLVQSWTVDFWWGYWPVARKTSCVSVHAKGGHFEYSLWTDNVDFVHICYIQCNLFDFYIFILRNHASSVGQYIPAHFTKCCSSRFDMWWKIVYTTLFTSHGTLCRS